MKYEFKATGRIFLPMFGALLLVAVFNKLFTQLESKIPMFIGTTISVFMIISICAIAVILTLQRFNKNLLGREGYLMFTLPVSTDSLIWSKLFVASIWVVISLFVVMAAVTIMAATGESFKMLIDSISKLLSELRSLGFNVVLLSLEGILLCVATLFSGILLLYACLALSLLVNKHRIGFAFLMYIGFSIIAQTIAAVLATVINFTHLEDFFTDLTAQGQVQLVFGACFVWLALSGIVCYVLTRYMLKRKLNLE